MVIPKASASNIGFSSRSLSFTDSYKGPNEILGISFNQDGHCFGVGLETGIRVYNSDPLRETMRKEFEDSGVAIVEMLYRSNIFVLVGGGRNPRFPPNKVVLYDHKNDAFIAELEFRSDVKCVKLSKAYIVVILMTKIFVYSFEVTPQKLLTYETGDNELGICSLCPDPDKPLLAFPAKQEGYIQIINISGDQNQSSLIRAHKSRLACLSFNSDGTKLASASKKGTLIRVFNMLTSRPECELRRGTDRADIFCLTFSPDSSKICVASDKGTVHIFKLETKDVTPLSDDDIPEEKKSASSNKIEMVKELLPKYFSSKWSFAHFKVSEAKCTVTFGAEPNIIIVISIDGGYYKYAFDMVRGGECVRESYHKYNQLGYLE